MGFVPLSVDEQLRLLDEWVHDPRGVVPTGWKSVDDLLFRGGFAPSNYVVIGGRTRTRKTTWTLNLIARFLEDGHSVGLIGLDESPNFYALKLMGVMCGQHHEWLLENWESPPVQQIRDAYRKFAHRFSLSRGFRPSFERLSQWREMASVNDGIPPYIIFIDYTSLLERDQYAGAEVQRVHRLIEEGQVWTNESSVVTLALHQVGRLDEGAGQRYHGDTPMSLESLKFGGEEIADLVFGTYRLSLDTVGNMNIDQAKSHLGKEFDEEEWQERVHRVKRYTNSTFVQLLKNRPGTKTNEQGLEFKQDGERLRMVPAGPQVGEDMQLRRET